MASGIINLGSSGYLEGRIVWSSASNGSSSNSSQVTANIQAHRTNSYTTTGTWSGYLSVNGTSENISNYCSISSDWVTLKTIIVTVSHNDNGTKSIIISGKVQGPSGTALSGNSVESSDTVVLDTIPRYLSINSLSIQSKTINTAIVKWSVSDARDATQYSLNGGEWQYDEVNNNASDNKSGSFTISNLNANTTYTLKIRCKRADSQLWTESSTISFTTYDYAKLSSVPNVNIGSSHTITWSNPAGATTSLKLCKTDNSTIIDYGTVTGTSKAITPTAATIYSLTPNSNTYTARYIITTTQNGKTYTNFKDFTFSVTNSNPAFSNFEYQDTNAITTALTGNNQILVKGYSNLKATISADNKAVAKNSANMESYKLVSGSKSTSANYSSTADVSLSVNNVDSGTIVLYATDSRGNSTPVTKTATYKEYTDLVIKSVTAERGSNGVGQDVTLKFNGTYWNSSFGNVNNEVANAKYYYRETTSNDWIEGETELTFTVKNDQFTGEVSIKGDLGANGFDVSNSYYIRLQVADKLVTKTYDVILGSGTPAIAIYKNKVAIGGKYDSSNGATFQVNGNVSSRGIELYHDSTPYIDFHYENSSDDYTSRIIESEKGLLKITGKLAIGNIAANTTDTWIPVINNGELQYTKRKFYNGTVHTNYPNDKDFLVTLDFLSYWRGAYNSSGTSSLQYCADGEIQGKPVSLYDNSSGTTGSITLSQTAANFSYLEICYAHDTDTGYSSIRIPSPNGKRGNLQVVGANETNYIAKYGATVAISGTSLTFSFGKGISINGTNFTLAGFTNSNEIKIYKVLGWR